MPHCFGTPLGLCPLSLSLLIDNKAQGRYSASATSRTAQATTGAITTISAIVSVLLQMPTVLVKLAEPLADTGWGTCWAAGRVGLRSVGSNPAEFSQGQTQGWTDRHLSTPTVKRREILARFPLLFLIIGCSTLQKSRLVRN